MSDIDEFALEVEQQIAENEAFLEQFRDSPSRQRTETDRLIAEVQEAMDHGSRRLTHY